MVSDTLSHTPSFMFRTHGFLYELLDDVEVLGDAVINIEIKVQRKKVQKREFIFSEKYYKVTRL